MIDYKKAFYSKLEDCYLGVKIKNFHKGNTAKSGFSNLLKIKEQYFFHIKTYLESQIESEPFSHDIYNKLFTFFDSYLNESGTPFFNDTPIYKNIYAKVYSNSKDTSLFYKTQNLYYVKSDILYQSLTLSDEQENYEVVFDASEYQQNADNTKNKVIFKLDSVSCNEFAKADEESPNQIIIKVINQKDLFPELNNVFKQNSSEFSEDFLRILKQKKLKFNEENLKKIFRSYKKQSEIDFFIHKNAKAFLQEQFDLWMFHYLYQESEIQEWNPQIIAHLQRIKNIAYEIIKLIADFENELKAIWLKPKFAKKTEYVFSVDRILQYAHNANVLIESIANDKGFESQIKEWQELKLIDETFDKQSFLDFCHSEVLHGKAEESKNNKCCYLPIDTKHFSEATKHQILSSFNDLESMLNGELIKSDNFQALNTLMPKYQGKMDLIYIDPPYNTGNDGFIYADNFNHASWLSMMNHRLELARELLNLKGSMFISIDDKEQARLKLVCDEVFGEENFVSNMVWQKKTGSSDAKNIATITEYILCYAKEQNNLELNKNIESYDENRYRYSDKYIKVRGKYYIDNLDRGGLSYSDSLNYAIECPDGSFTYPNGRLKYENDGWIWKWGKEKLKWGLDNGFIEFRQSKTKESGWAVCYKNYMKVDNENRPIIRAAPFKNLLTEVMNYHATQEIKLVFETLNFDTPKPEKLLQRILEIASNGHTPPQSLPQGEGLLSSKIHSPSLADMATSNSLVTANNVASNSPSLAEGVRGWVVSSTKTLQTKNHRYLAPYMKEFSREMRKNPTEAENKLWNALRNKKMGFGFRRQFVIDSKYIADFVCLEKRLIIECDGGQHSESFEDKERDFYLESQDFRILRFWNNEILENLEGVIGKIQEVMNNSADLTHPLTPSAREGESEENSTQKNFSNHRQISTNQKLNASLVLDFFAGSGTTLAVAQKLGRKWLGVEMGEHFYNVMIPRLKKVIAGFQSGISKECDYKGGGAFRYYGLESYEEALSHCEYVLECKEPQKLENKNGYKGKDYAKCEAILDYRKSRKLIDKLNKGEIVSLDMSTEYRQDFDIFQTIANLMGWKIKRLFLDSKGIESCEFDNGEILNLDSLDLAKYPKLKNLIWWE